MKPSRSAATPAADAPATRLMWIDADRTFYAGLLGVPSVRSLGAFTVYASLEAPVRVCLQDEEWQQCALAVVPPFLPHRVQCEGRLIGVLLIEPETLALDCLPDFLRSGPGALHEPVLLERIRATYARLRDAGSTADLSTANFDLTLWGECLPRRVLEPRIQAVVDAIKGDPRGRFSADDCAASVQLSSWRFLHLFKTELGVPFRNFRSWKRARSLLHYVTREASLVNVALEAGYPDSTHFSHSIRQVFGLKPKDIFAGSRKLAVYGDRPVKESPPHRT